MPGDSKRRSYCKDCVQIIVIAATRCRGWESKDNKVVNPFKDGVNTVGAKDLNTCIHYMSLDAPSRGKTFDGIMLNVEFAIPMESKIFLVSRCNGGSSMLA